MVFEWTDADGDRCGLGEDGRVYVLNDRVVGIENHYVLASSEVAEDGIAEAVRQLEVYRKALEPFAAIYGEAIGPEALDVRTTQEIETVVWLDREERAALREACRLMGIEIAADLGDAP